MDTTNLTPEQAAYLATISCSMTRASLLEQLAEAQADTAERDMVAWAAEQYGDGLEQAIEDAAAEGFGAWLEWAYSELRFCFGHEGLVFSAESTERMQRMVEAAYR